MPLEYTAFEFETFCKKKKKLFLPENNITIIIRLLLSTKIVKPLSFLCRGDSSPANRSLDFLEANPPLRTALEARRLRSSSDHDDEVLSDNSGGSDEAVTRKSSMESVTSNDSGMASNLSEDGGSRKTSEVSVTAEGSPSHEGNNNSLPKEVSYAELELLKKLEEQNRYVMFFFFIFNVKLSETARKFLIKECTQ